MEQTEKQTFANADVLEFYKKLPFNYYSSKERQAESLQNQKNMASMYHIEPYLKKDIRFLDVGCGAGWFANSIAHYFQCNVTAIDFNLVAVKRAQEVSDLMKLNVNFFEQDLFLYYPEERYDFVNSLGVLHHTDNCQHAVRHICQNYIKDGGYIHIGLYHLYGRKPFLDYFERLKREGSTEEKLFEKYKELHSNLKDQTHLESWFRDQVLHPHETQHTLKEMAELLKEEGFTIEATSINRFEPISDLNELFELEKQYQKTGEQALVEKRYFPGFYTFLAKKD